MANHSYVTIGEKLKGDDAERVLREVVFSAFDPTLFMVTQREDLEPFWQNARVWWVHIPNSAPEDDVWQPEDYGFLVFYHVRKSMWEFRHPINMWERWCQSRVKYLLAQLFGAKIIEDADDKVHSVKGKEAKEVLKHSSFSSFLGRNFKRPLKEDDRAWVQKLLDTWAPPGQRTLE